MASGHREAPHPKAGHMAAPTSDSASGQQSSCQHGAVHTWRKGCRRRVRHDPLDGDNLGVEARALHARCTRHFKGLSGQVKLFPVAFDSGKGCVLKDVDGNEYIDFSSGIYVTTLGHCHPKISEAVAKYASRLVNAHDFGNVDR